jgi:rhodanese-related sulfurtransferase
VTTSIDRRGLIRLIDDEGAQVVDVLPEREYSNSHIPGAINIPLKMLNDETSSILKRDKAVVVC